MKTRVLCVGSGAIGSYYSGILHRGGAEVTLLCRSDYETIKEHGICIKSCDGDFSYHPTKVIKSASEITEFPDYILVFLKVLPEIDTISLIKDAVGPKTVIVLIQNGIDIERPIQDEFPKNEVIGGLAFICCQRIKSGQIDHQDYGHLKLGTFPSAITVNGEKLQQLFIDGGIDCFLSENLLASRWEKLIWNAPFNPLSAILGGVDTKCILADDESYNLCRNIMTEVVLLSEKSGNPVSISLVQKNLDYTNSMVAYKTSMCLDYEKGRNLEVEAILGNAVRIARKVNVPVPYLETTYALLRQVDLKLRSER